MTDARATERATLHFDLNHVAHLGENATFTLRGDGKGRTLVAHTDESRERAAAENIALAAMAREHRSRFTHYLDDVEMPAHEVAWRWISYQSHDPNALTEEAALHFQHCASEHVHYAAEAIRRDTGAPVATMHGDAIPIADDDTHGPMHVAASMLINNIKTAVTIVMQHPNLANVVPRHHSQIQLKVASLPSITPVWQYLSTHTPGPGESEPWYVQKASRDPQGKILTPYAKVKGKCHKFYHWPTNNDGQAIVPIHDLSPGLATVVTPALKAAITAISADSALKGTNWTTQHGVVVKDRTQEPMKPALAAAAAKADWSLKNIGSTYGLSLYGDSLSYDSVSGALSFDVKNWPNRGLGVHWQPLDVNNKPLADPEWLKMISSGVTIFGAPVTFLTSKTTISVNLPPAATQVDVFFGGIGQAPHDEALDLEGIIYTSIVSFGVPAVLMALSVGSLSNAVAMKAFGSPAVIGALIALVKGIIVPLYPAGIAPAKMLSAAAEFVPGVIFGLLYNNTATAKAAAAIAAEAAAEEGVEAVPVVGWPIKLASIVAGAADLIATGVEVGLSPATYTIEAKRSMSLNVTVNPDPTHGTKTQPAIWPKSADHWIITVQYKGGTTLRKAGAIPPGSDPIIAFFSSATNDAIPSAPGQQFQIIAAVYSKTNWMAGQWISGWIDAVPTDGDSRAEQGSIIEKLVPLTADTTYSQLQQLHYDGTSASYVWQGISFSLKGALAGNLTPGTVAQPIVDAFWTEGVRIAATSTVAANGTNAWTLDDPTTDISYSIALQDIVADGETLGTELEVANTTYPRPTGTADDLPNQHVAELTDITINDLAYKVGYAYLADDQDMPVDYGTDRTNQAMYQFESISSLANPQAGMKRPTRGFSSRPFIAYDQFGPTGLFQLTPAAGYQNELNNLETAGPVPADIATAFAEAGHPLPEGATAVVVTASAAWLIASSDGTPLYDLRREIDVIKVFAAPAPEFSPNNFYLDTRTYGTDGLRHLRRVDLNDSSGPTFDYDKPLSWGAFTMTDLSAICVHPSGYVIAISYKDHKMSILKLPEAGVEDAKAPIALPMSGKGLREGLMMGPVAMTISADGRVLVLERDAARIQAFDNFANPAQSFAAELEFTVANSFAQDLNTNTISPALMGFLQKSVPVKNPAPDAFDKRYLLQPVVIMQSSYAAVFDAGTVTADLIEQFKLAGIPLPADATITTTTAGSLWFITHPSVGTLDVRLNGEGSGHVDVYHGMTPTVTVKAENAEWIVRDQTNTLSFDVKVQKAGDGADNGNGGDVLHWQRLSAFMRLKTGSDASVVYLDVAIESKGFIYVLAYVTPQSGTLSPDDYRLDIYNPDGSPVSSDPAATNGSVNAGRMTVDQWRTLFSLNYQEMTGPAGRPEPSISQWTPSTPIGPTPRVRLKRSPPPASPSTGADVIHQPTVLTTPDITALISVLRILGASAADSTSADIQLQAVASSNNLVARYDTVTVAKPEVDAFMCGLARATAEIGASQPFLRLVAAHVWADFAAAQTGPVSDWGSGDYLYVWVAEAKGPSVCPNGSGDEWVNALVNVVTNSDAVHWVTELPTGTIEATTMMLILEPLTPAPPGTQQKIVDFGRGLLNGTTWTNPSQVATTVNPWPDMRQALTTLGSSTLAPNMSFNLLYPLIGLTTSPTSADRTLVTNLVTTSATTPEYPNATFADQLLYLVLLEWVNPNGPFAWTAVGVLDAALELHGTLFNNDLASTTLRDAINTQLKNLRASPDYPFVDGNAPRPFDERLSDTRFAVEKTFAQSGVKDAL